MKKLENILTLMTSQKHEYLCDLSKAAVKGNFITLNSCIRHRPKIKFVL